MIAVQRVMNLSLRNTLMQKGLSLVSRCNCSSENACVHRPRVKPSS